MGLLDLDAQGWHPALLDLVGLTPDHLPALQAPGTILGTISADASRRTGLPPGLPLVAGAGDGQAAALGAALQGPHELYLNLGTAVVSGSISPTPQRSTSFRTLLGAAPKTYLLETDLKGGTFTLHWLARRWLDPHADDAKRRDLLAHLETQSATLPPGSEGLVTLPYWCGVMNPYWDDRASGLTMGWRDRHGPAHLYRSILEGIALEQRLATDALQASLGDKITRLVAVGGGAHSDLWCQILADTTGRELVRAQHAETTALGAASLAAFGVGLTDTPDALALTAPRGRTFSPGPHADAYDALYRDVYHPLYPRVRDLMAHLA
jgi:xylulokinase